MLIPMQINDCVKKLLINPSRFALGLWLILATSHVCLATETATTPDLAELIECRQDYRALRVLAPPLTDHLAAISQGWQPLPQRNLFMSEYRLLAPISVFGHSTEYIAVSGAAILAILDLPDPRVLAQELELEAAIDTTEKMMFGREVFSREIIDESGGQPMIESAVLVVSNVTSHPGKTLVGCEYSLDVDEGFDEVQNPPDTH